MKTITGLPSANLPNALVHFLLSRIGVGLPASSNPGQHGFRQRRRIGAFLQCVVVASDIENRGPGPH